MIVPKFWAEGRAHQPRQGKEGKQVTVRRFGWSDTSQADAQAMAEQRANEALDRIRRGEKLARREPKLAYNGAAGVPIREEIVATHGETVITRNLYGAKCLNTPNVLFADIDFEPVETGGLGCLLGIMALVGAPLVGRMAFGNGAMGFLVGLSLVILAYWIGYNLRRWGVKLRGGAEKLARTRLQSFVSSHPDWHLRLYRTPAGFRVLAMNRTFKPDEPAVTKFFNWIGADELYVRMCRNQQCFRARLTPKPWRIGVADHLKPRPGVWPVKPEHLPRRQAWVRQYEQKSQAFAACAFLDAFGSSATTTQTSVVQRLHDEISRATTGLPIA